ncbi:acyltransferase family protein [Rubrolithibacter danxiaensis]|uniref:acyltransferase family protein n=1 Tax=Rubrolithibacter danxiaensis TaxID=3390805 RepID=UPI003BF782F2
MIETFTANTKTKLLETEEKIIPLNFVKKKSERLYFLDWLRVTAFAILIIMHTAEVFADRGGWIKNTETSRELTYILLFFRQWRMPLLFIISGAAVSMMLKKISTVEFLKSRGIHILLPLLAGMIIIIPPQIYYINHAEGSFLQIYQDVFTFNWFPKGNFHWLHLWYLAFLFAFTIILTPLIITLKTEKGKTWIDSICKRLNYSYVLFTLALLLEAPFYLVNLWKPRSDLSALLFYFPYFAFGALLFTNPGIRSTFKIYKQKSLILAVATTSILYLFFWITDDRNHTVVEPILTQQVNDSLHMLLETLNRWFWLITFFGYSMQYLNFGSRSLSYANKAVYPFYILHQTVIIMLAYYVVKFPGNMTYKFIAILSFTFIIIMALFEFVLKRTKITRMLFGIKL